MPLCWFTPPSVSFLIGDRAIARSETPRWDMPHEGPGDAKVATATAQGHLMDGIAMSIWQHDPVAINCDGRQAAWPWPRALASRTGQVWGIALASAPTWQAGGGGPRHLPSSCSAALPSASTSPEASPSESGVPALSLGGGSDADGSCWVRMGAECDAAGPCRHPWMQLHPRRHSLTCGCKATA